MAFREGAAERHELERITVLEDRAAALRLPAERVYARVNLLMRRTGCRPMLELALGQPGAVVTGEKGTC